MKYLMAIFLLLGSFAPMLAQTDCGARLDTLIREADNDFKHTFYRQAYEKYRAARGCDKADLAYIDKQMVAAMDGIDAQREQAKKRELEAIAARAAAEKSKKEALAAKDGLQKALLDAEAAKNEALAAKNEALLAKKVADSLGAINRKQFEDLRSENDQKISVLLRKADQYLKRLEYDSAFLTCQTIYSMPEGNKRGQRILFELLYFFSESGQFEKSSDALILAGQSGVPVKRASISSFLKDWNTGLYDTLMLRYYPEVVAVKGGIFLMGADPGRDGGLLEDAPLHYASVGDFSIGKTEVTKRQLLVFAVRSGLEGLTLSKSVIGKWADDPVENVRWLDAIAYLNWLNTQMGKEPLYQLQEIVVHTANGGKDTITQVSIKGRLHGYRLPTEVEWEYAARGGQYLEQFRYPGSNRSEDVAWQKGKTNKLQAVARLGPNELGLFDMSGNVAEWCEDVYVPKTTSRKYTQPYQNYLNKYLFPDQLRVNRGSSYKDLNRIGELAQRDYLNIGVRREVGFRIVLTEPGLSAQNK